MRTWKAFVFPAELRDSCSGSRLLSTSHSVHPARGGRTLGRLLVALMVCIPAGCGNTNGPFALNGTVSLEGQPLEQGSISFASVTPGSRSSTGGAIANGEYSITAKEGLLPGTYRVTISAADLSNATPDGLPANGLAFPSLVDPEFNKANHEIVITSDGPNTFTFDVPKNKKKKSALPF